MLTGTEAQLLRAQRKLNKLNENHPYETLKIKNAQDKVDFLKGRLDNERAIKQAKAGATKIDKSKKKLTISPKLTKK